MLWRDPNLLWLLVAVVALAVTLLWLHGRRRAALGAFAEPALTLRLTRNVDRRRRLWRNALRLAALTLLVIALAGPKWGFHWEEVHREGIDLLVALDTSRSMLATDVKPNRLERAKLAVLDMTKLLQGDRIGLVAFAGSAFLECPLTLDYGAFEHSLRAVEVGLIPRGGTALARAIDTSLAAFEARQGRYEALILITDGEDHEGDLGAALTAAKEHGIKIFAVGIGTVEGELLPVAQGEGGFVKDRKGQVVKSRLDEETLQKIAIDTGGAYVRGLGPALGLDEVFRDHIAKMERREVASSLEKRFEARFQIPLAAALLLLFLEGLLGDRKPAARKQGRRASGGRVSRWRRSRQPEAALALLALLPFLVGWFDPPGDRAGEGNRLFDAGDYATATEKYGEGLVDAPESPLLQFNMAAALYKQGKFAESIASLNRVLASGKPEWTALAAYNLGNAQYRLGANAEESEPQAAITSYQEALVSYKRSMSANSSDEDAKFNHELTLQTLHTLEKRLEEERQKGEQEQVEQQQEEEQNEQPQEEQPQEDEQQQEEQNEPQQQEEQNEQPQEDQPQEEEPAPGEEQQPEPDPSGDEDDQGDPGSASPEQQPAPKQQEEAHQQQAGGASETAGEEQPSADQQAAQAVLDTAREEELGPEEMRRQVGVAGIGEPAEDW